MSVKFLFRALFSFLLASLSFAAEKTPSAYVTFDSPSQFSSERLFDLLDSVGNHGNWMEFDERGIEDPSLARILDNKMQSTAKPKMVWVLSERGVPLVSVLVQKGSGESLVFYETKLDAAPVDLQVNRELSPDAVFRDYTQVSPNLFVHKDRLELKVQATDSFIRFTYEKRDATPLRFDKDFSKKSIVEKRTEVKNYRDFFMYEYSLMLRAFVQSTRGLFNWQPWHWYMDSFMKKGFITDGEIESILERGVGGVISIFRARTANGETVNFSTDGNGFYEMTIRNP